MQTVSEILKMAKVKANDILKDDDAEKAFKKILESNYKSAEKVKGIFQDGNKFIAFDNTTGECWQEEFVNIKPAVAWLNL